MDSGEDGCRSASPLRMRWFAGPLHIIASLLQHVGQVLADDDVSVVGTHRLVPLRGSTWNADWECSTVLLSEKSLDAGGHIEAIECYTHLADSPIARIVIGTNHHLFGIGGRL